MVLYESTEFLIDLVSCIRGVEINLDNDKYEVYINGKLSTSYEDYETLAFEAFLRGLYKGFLL